MYKGTIGRNILWVSLARKGALHLYYPAEHLGRNKCLQNTSVMNEERHEPSAHVIDYLTVAPDLSESDVASFQCVLYLSELLIWAITKSIFMMVTIREYKGKASCMCMYVTEFKRYLVVYNISSNLCSFIADSFFLEIREKETIRAEKGFRDQGPHHFVFFQDVKGLSTLSVVA